MKPERIIAAEFVLEQVPWAAKECAAHQDRDTPNNEDWLEAIELVHDAITRQEFVIQRRNPPAS